MAIEFVAAGASNAQAGTTVQPALPAGLAEGDILICVLNSRAAPGVTWSNNGGYVQIPGDPNGYQIVNGASDVAVEVWYKIAGPSEAAPTFTVSSGVGGYSATLLAWRGVDPTTPFDVEGFGEGAAAAQTFTPAAVVTITANAWVVSVVGTPDDNTLTLSVSQSFNSRLAFATLAASDHAIAVADKAIASPGSTTLPTWNQATAGNDQWAGVSFALMEEGAGGGGGGGGGGQIGGRIGNSLSLSIGL